MSRKSSGTVPSPRSALAVLGALPIAIGALTAAPGAAWSAPGAPNPSATTNAQPVNTVSTLAQVDDPADLAGMWTGSSSITMNRSTPDVAIGYTMRADFWFRIDDDGQVSGHAYAVYQPTFKAPGLDAKITLAKNYVNGAVGLLPGGQLGMLGGLLNAAKEGGKLGIAGIVGVTGKYKDPQPVRSGEIVGYVDEATNTIHIDWANDAQAAAIPLSVSLAYINEKVPVTEEELDLWTPWREPATVSEGSQGWLAVSETSEKNEPDDGDNGTTSSTTQFWTAHRVGSADG